MNIRKPLIAVVIANFVVLIVLGAVGSAAMEWAISKPIPVYGSLKQASFSLAYPVLREIVRMENHANVTYFMLNGPINPVFPDSYRNVTFAFATLNLTINSTGIVQFGLGGVNIKQIHDEKGNSEVFDGLANLPMSYPSFQAEKLQTTLTWSTPQLPPFSSTWEWTYVQNSSNAYLYKFQCWPCFYWTLNANVVFDYVETWNYIPIDHYDNSTIEHGKAVLASLPPYFISLGISDVVAVGLLVGFWLTSPETIDRIIEQQPTTEKQLDKCGDCKKYDSRTRSCDLTHEGRDPLQPSCKEGEPN